MKKLGLSELQGCSLRDGSRVVADGGVRTLGQQRLIFSWVLLLFLCLVQETNRVQVCQYDMYHLLFM